MTPKLAAVMAVMAPSYLLTLFALAVAPYLAPPDIVFGVRLPHDRRRDPAVLAIRRRYWLGVAAVALLGAGVGMAAYEAGGLVPGLLSAVLGTVAAGLGNTALSHAALEHLKQAEGYMRGLKEVSVARLDPKPSPSRLGVGALMALALVAAGIVTAILRYPHLPARIPVHYNGLGLPNRYAIKSPLMMFTLLLPVDLVVLLVVGLSWWAPRTRRDLDAARPEVSDYQQAVFGRRNRTLLEGAALLVAIEALFTNLRSWGILKIQGPWFVGVTFFPVAVLLVSVFWVSLRTGQMGSRVTPPRPAPQSDPTVIHRDDDRYWRAGVFYVNRTDPAWFVPKRFGYGYTINMGHPASLVGAVVVIGLLVAVPVLMALARHG